MGITAELDGLHGTLTLPTSTEMVPVTLILPGSGPVDRDGNLPSVINNSLKLLAEGLAAHGIGALRIDKRGVGESLAQSTAENGLRFSTYVDDAIRWSHWLEAQPRMKTLFIIGHSEGALVGTLAAQKHHYQGMVLLAGAGECAGNVLLRQIRAKGLPLPLLAEAQNVIGRLTTGKRVLEISPPLESLFRQSVQPYLMSWFPVDPVKELGKTSAPALVVQGGTDMQTSLQDADMLATARPGIEKLIWPSMNHVLKSVTMERNANLATYSNPELPLSNGLVMKIAEFIKRNRISDLGKPAG
ncbi:alpha/beta fold hydrolase [Ochrobactrum sp. CM-21-5]|nr:alpha/beta fold hydrolase [Ochrobactrum sp. CM-21-5]